MSKLCMNSPLLILRLCALLPGALLAAACATNPVTGQSDFVLMSEEQEVQIGREAAPEIIKQFGQYEGQALQDYVQRVGERLAANSHRANLVYRFTVLDTADVNAFALPGGYIYITRGLLAYLNSEAELAAVLAHEIGHVTARHGVRQQSTAQAADLGYALGSILLPELRNQGAQQVFNVVGGAWLAGYGREHELEADRLGAEYLAQSGYDPQAMIKVISVLKDQESFERQIAQEEGREARVYHGLFATHPDNDTRLQQVVGSAERFRGEHTVQVRKEDYIRALDGLTFGDSEKEGVRRGSAFYHAGLGFALRFPEGWRVENRPDQVAASAPGNAASLHLFAEDINQRVAPDQFLRTRLKLTKLEQGESFTHQGMPGYTALASTRTPFGVRPVRFTVLYFNNKAYIFAGAAKDERNPYAYDAQFIESARSFRALTAQERPLATALKLKIVRAKPNTRFAALARESGIPHHAEEQLRLLNQLYPDGEPQPGDSIKTVH